MNPNNARPFRITAAAGTELAGASFGGTVWRKGLITLSPSFPLTGVYNPKAFILHAALLRQAFAHCAISLTAASRRSLDRMSVPVWGVTLSGPLPVVGLVSRYLTNYLMGRSPRPPPRKFRHLLLMKVTVCGISTPFGLLFPAEG